MSRAPGKKGLETPQIAFVKLPQTYANWNRHPPLGLGYIVAYLEHHGYSCEVFDAYFNNWTFDELRDRVCEAKPDIIGFTAMTHEITAAARLAALCKEQKQVTTIVGGPHTTALPEQTLEEFTSFDFAANGEGEKTMLELVRCLESSDCSFESIMGLVYREDGTVKQTEPRPFLTAEELDELPFPAIDHYYEKSPEALSDKHHYYKMYSGRGCPYHCSFCMQVLGHKVRRRSIPNVISEMQYAIETYGAHTFHFDDEIFLFNNTMTKQLLKEISVLRQKHGIRWAGSIRADHVTDELIALAKEAGCFSLGMGVESGDDEILKKISKKISVEKITEAVSIIKKHDIPLAAYFILGHPDETVETVGKTIALSAKLNTDSIAVGTMVPYPGTKVYDWARNGEHGYRLLSEDWQKYDKYFGECLELEGVTNDQLQRAQKLAFLNLYIRNFRVVDLMVFIWEKRQAVLLLFRRFFRVFRKN